VIAASPRDNPRTTPITKTQVEVITSVQRRRSWSRAEKERIVAAAMEPGAIASEVARAAGIHTSQLFRWRQQLCERSRVPAAFNSVAITPAPEAPLPPVAERAGVIEIEFATGGRMRITGRVDAPTVAALMKALAKSKRLRCSRCRAARGFGWRPATPIAARTHQQTQI
jgi:transposase